MTNQRPVNLSDSNDSQDDNVHGRKVTPSEASYRDGYVEGQAVERSQAVGDQYAREEVHESNGVASGMVIGLAFAAVVGLVGGGLYFATRGEPDTVPVAAPAPASPQPQRNTTIIERTIERTKEAAPSVQAPDVKINVQQPAPAVAPAVAPAAPAPAPAPATPAAPDAPPTSDSSNSEPSATESSSANDLSKQPSGTSENTSGNPAQ